jgi:hypothetical protein
MLNVPYYFCAILKTHLFNLTVKYDIWLANQDVASVSRYTYSDYPFDIFKLEYLMVIKLYQHYVK